MVLIAKHPGEHRLDEDADQDAQHRSALVGQPEDAAGRVGLGGGSLAGGASLRGNGELVEGLPDGGGCGRLLVQAMIDAVQ